MILLLLLLNYSLAPHWLFPVVIHRLSSFFLRILSFFSLGLRDISRKFCVGGYFWKLLMIFIWGYWFFFVWNLMRWVLILILFLFLNLNVFVLEKVVEVEVQHHCWNILCHFSIMVTFNLLSISSCLDHAFFTYYNIILWILLEWEQGSL